VDTVIVILSNRKIFGHKIVDRHLNTIQFCSTDRIPDLSIEYWASSVNYPLGDATPERKLNDWSEEC
jgi:hypothetical protein